MNRARCSFAYDINNELVLDSIITKYKSCEKELAVAHLDRLNPESDVLVFDRGYPCLWLMGLLQEKRFKFCFRLSSSWKDAVNLTKSKENDINWTSKRRSKKDLGHLKTYNLSKELGGMRLVSIPLSSGETEILATNLLDRSIFSLEVLKELYNLRWGVEEAYKLFKKSIHIESFTGKSTKAIEQDFYAKVFMLNMASMIRTQYFEPLKTIPKKPQIHSKRANKTQVLAKTKDFLIELFYTRTLEKVLTQLKNMIDKCFEIVRPNRSFKRYDSSSKRRHKSLTSKGI
jgi:hypothetical protein